MNPSSLFVSRGGLKLEAALDAFHLDVTGFTCADLGCNIGGFTDCLLRRGAAKVYAIDTGYGALAWKLRNDPRVVVMERTNALHVETPVTGIDLAVIDLAWTPQRYAIPGALRWKPGRIITLIKPHYEATPDRSQRGVLDESESAKVTDRVLEELPALGVKVMGHIRSPIFGGAGKKRVGNVEYLALLSPSGQGEGEGSQEPPRPVG